MAIQVTDLVDLLNSTTAKYTRDTFEDLSLPLQSYVMIPQILRKNMESEPGGTSLKFDLMTGTNLNASAVGFFYKRDIAAVDNSIQGDVPWSRYQNHYAMETGEVELNARYPEKIVSLKSMRRAGCIGDLVKIVETDGWGNSSSALKIKGVRHWIVKSTASAPALTANLPTGYTSIAGIIPSTANNWMNHAGAFTTISEDDGIAKMRKTAFLCDFRNPVKKYVSEIASSQPDRGWYMGYDIAADIEKYLKTQNEQLGNEADPFRGKGKVSGVSVYAVPHLDDDSDDPMYLIDWSKLYAKRVGDKEWLGENSKQHPDYPTTAVTDIVLPFFNLCCHNRRHLGVLSKTANNN